jgi:alpha-L-fucosidase
MDMHRLFEPTWSSLNKHSTPQWFKDAKFGIYTHWGVYSVPARGPNGTWYPYYMYIEGTPQWEHHISTYGGPEKFGYKDFIPQFTGERFDPDEWAEVFRDSGAQFAGPVGEHHDGFTMWNTRLNDWNAVRMGPRTDVVGRLEKAIRGQGLRFLVALHHAENWWFYPHWRREFDTSDPRYAGLYGEPHDLEGGVDHKDFFNQARPSRRFIETWKAKILEVIDTYDPDMLWFDFGLSGMPEKPKEEVLAYYYNKAIEHGRDVVVTYKDHDLPPGAGVVDLELRRMDKLTYHEWITDTTVDDGQGWGYLAETAYKTTAGLVHYLVDNVSKNGLLLLNVGPKPDGTLPEEAKELLRGMGRWLAVNGEAIYGTTTWITNGEGPEQISRGGENNETEMPAYSRKDVRFTVKGNVLYATVMGWPGEYAVIETLKRLWPDEIRSIRMLGTDQQLAWKLLDHALVIKTPNKKPCDHAYVFRIERGQPIR